MRDSVQSSPLPTLPLRATAESWTIDANHQRNISRRSNLNRGCGRATLSSKFSFFFFYFLVKSSVRSNIRPRCVHPPIGVACAIFPGRYAMTVLISRLKMQELVRASLASSYQ